MQKSIEHLKCKIEVKILDLIKEVEKYGSTTFSVCSHSNWDKDYYNHRDEISRILRSHKYNTSTTVRYGVIDILITKNLF
jgi:hypothetical protein